MRTISASASLKINCRKTITQSLKRNANGLVQVGDDQIEAVDKFTCLGSEIDACGGTDFDIEEGIILKSIRQENSMFLH